MNDMSYVYMSHRIPMWHEAGHAVVALHYGCKVKRIGLDPMPHCLVRQRGLSKHQRGVLLCAGAMMTKLIYGQEWGSDTDYSMAENYGDIEVFKRDAMELCIKYHREAGFLVDQLTPYPPSSLEPWYDPITPYDAHYEELMHIRDRAAFPQWQKGLVMKWARLQMRYPNFFAKLAKIAY